jgi:hypothetical protein
MLKYLHPHNNIFLIKYYSKIVWIIFYVRDKHFSYSLKFASNQPTSWLNTIWSTFCARTSHVQPWTHKIHHSLNSGEATTFPHIVFSAPLREAYIQMTFCHETPKGESRNCQSLDSYNCGTITPRLDLRSGWGLKQCCASLRNLSNGVLHSTCTDGGRVESQLFVVGSQTANLTLAFLFAITCVANVQMGHASPF